MKSNEKKGIFILITTSIIIIGTLFLISKNKKQENHTVTKSDQEIIGSAGIDVNDETYAGKKIYVQDGDVIIENQDGSKTIETTKKEGADLRETSQEEKTQYEITNVKVNISGNKTSVTGSITNKTKQPHKVSIGVKFYSSDGKRKGTGNIEIANLKVNETQDFEIVIMGNMTGYTHTVEVEYTN